MNLSAGWKYTAAVSVVSQPAKRTPVQRGHEVAMDRATLILLLKLIKALIEFWISR